ncbi:MAG: hypothetical protein ACRDLM_09985 [Gaiellaceae bacterium]
MPDGVLQERSERLAARVDALAGALRASGVSDAAASRLLEAASTAVLHALTLELLLESEPAPVTTTPEQPQRDPALPRAA